MSGQNSRIVGVIGKSYGNKGFVFVRLFTDYPDTFTTGARFYLDEECTVPVTIESVKNISLKGKPRSIVKFSGYDSMDEAEKLRDKPVYRSMKDQPALEAGNYWIDDLKDCMVYYKEKYFGKVLDVEKFAFNDNLIVEKENGEIFIIPLFEEYIGTVDIVNKRIELKELPEYI